MAKNALRWRRLTRGGALLMVPMDHGISMGPVEGLADPSRVLAAIRPYATCITVHKGLLPSEAGDLGVLLHLSASTDHGPDPHDKRLVATVEEAVKAGCDGVSIHINVGSTTEPRQLADAGAVSTACAQWGMPLIIMAYPRGPNVTDPRDARRVSHAARLAAELGADAVKVPYTGDEESFRRVVEGCPAPVIVAGGGRRDLGELLAELEGARRAGAAGVSIGRNVFQHDDPGAAMRAIHGLFSP